MKTGKIGAGRLDPAAFARWEKRCEGAIEKMRRQLDLEPGSMPTLESVGAIKVKLPSGETRRIDELARLGVESWRVKLAVEDDAYKACVGRALRRVGLVALSSDSSIHCSVESVESRSAMWQRMMERADRASQAAKAEVREARRALRRDQPQVHWSSGSEADRLVSEAVAGFEEAIEQLARAARHRA